MTRRERDLEDVRALLGTAGGARFFARLMDACGVYRLSYSGENTHETAFKEGQRNIGNMFMRDAFDVNADMSKFRRSIETETEEE